MNKTSCSYVRQHYDVPAEVGRRVVVNGKPGIIAEDKGQYIGVNFDEDQPGDIKNCHPTWEVQYLDMGVIRPLPKVKNPRSKQRYQEYLDADWYDGSFAEWLGIPKKRKWYET